MLSMLLTGCPSKTLPTRNFKVTLYKIKWEKRCVLAKGVPEKCYKKDKDFPKIIGITPEDYVKEREYQDDLRDAAN